MRPDGCNAGGVSRSRRSHGSPREPHASANAAVRTVGIDPTRHAFARPCGMTSVLQREIWNGRPERYPDAFTLRKRKDARTLTAVCEVWSHQFGWELRLQIDGRGLQMSSVVRSVESIAETVAAWKAAMQESGWQ